MWKYFSNFSKANNLGLFLLILTPIAFITGSFTANLFTILLIIFYFLYQEKNKVKNFINKYKWQITFILGITFLNIIFSEVKVYSFSKIIPFYRFFFFSIAIIFILKIISNNLNLYVNLMIIITLFLIIDSFIQLYFGKDIFGFPFNKDYGRITGPFNDEMIIGNFLFYFGFLSLAFLNYVYSISQFKNIFILLLLSLTILATGERTPFISLFYFYLFIFLFSNKKKLIFFSTTLLIILSTIIINNSERLSNKYSIASLPKLTDIDSKTFREYSSERNVIKKKNISEHKEKNLINKLSPFFRSNQYIGHYSRAIDIIKQNYFFGSGFKSYRKICGYYETLKQPNQYNTDKNRRLTCSIHPHNYHLEILSDTGLFGYIVFISFVIYICYSFFKKKLYKNFSICILFCLIMTYIIPFKPTGSFFSTNTAFIFWYLIGHFFYFTNSYSKSSNFRNFSNKQSVSKNTKNYQID